MGSMHNAKTDEKLSHEYKAFVMNHAHIQKENILLKIFFLC